MEATWKIRWPCRVDARVGLSTRHLEALFARSLTRHLRVLQPALRVRPRRAMIRGYADPLIDVTICNRILFRIMRSAAAWRDEYAHTFQNAGAQPNQTESGINTACRQLKTLAVNTV